MRLDRYSAINFDALRPEDLAPAISAWVVPDVGPARVRRQRLGVPAAWRASSLLVTDDLIGNDGCSVKVRWAGDRSEYLLRFVHRDDNPSVLWTVMFRLSSSGGGTLLEAAVARDAPRDVHLEPTASAPRVVVDLIKAHESNVRPREMVLPQLNATTPADAVAIVDELLLRPERHVPVVLVARDVYGSGAAVDLAVIARRMQGIAVVASLDGMEATAAFASALTARGHSLDLQCFNGAVHTYGAAANIDVDHRLWLRRSLETLSEEIRSEYVGEALARHLSLDRAPPGFLFAVEDFDRAERARKRPSTRRAALAIGDDAGVQRLMADLEAAEKLLGEVQDQAIRAEEARRSTAQQCEVAELEASTERMLRESLQTQLVERRTSAAHAAMGADLRDGLRSLVCKTGSPTPLQALQLLEALFPERLVVLPEALNSAEVDGARFRKPDEVFSLLLRLCTGYYDGLLKGGDTVAKQAFSKWEYAAQGSDGEVNSAACERDRTRAYKGKPLVMWAHLRAGGKGAAEDCLRIHFAWAPEDRKIVVGHCGAHLKEP
jgi:hypothetical protein